MGEPVNWTRNKLLIGLGRSDVELLRPGFESVFLEAGTCLFQPRVPIEHVYFLETGVASVVAGRAGGKPAEVGLIGREGFSGLPVIHGSSSSPHECYVQVGGAALRLRVSDLRRAFDRSELLRTELLRFVHAFMIQMGETARANSRLTIEKRLARWLLMAQDRLDGASVPLTHEVLSLLVGTRRVAITMAVRNLQRMGGIKAERGRVVILSREKLKAIAGDSYGVPESYWPLQTNDLNASGWA